LVPKCDSNDGNLAQYSLVEVKGNIAHSACVVTERNDVVITDDITYDNVNYSNTPAQIQSEILSELNTPKFTILSGIGYENGGSNGTQYRGDVWVNTSDDINISASIFTPKGEFGGFGLQGSPGSPGALEYAANMGYDIHPKCYGSVIMNNKGIWHMGAVQGSITPEFYDDKRFKDSNDRPLGYIPAVGLGLVNEAVNILNYGYNWKVEW